MYDTKKGKYSPQEEEYILSALQKGIENGQKEREILKEIAEHLNRGYAGIMSHVRKLKTQNPEKFPEQIINKENQNKRLNSWEIHEEELLINTVNQYMEENKSLSLAIQELEKKLNRTQGAIYQRIYTLRRKSPEKFTQLPAQRPRRRRKIPEWQVNRPTIRNLDDNLMPNISSLNAKPLSNYPNLYWNSHHDPESQEEAMVYQVFEERFGKLTPTSKNILADLMRQYGCTRVSISLLTLQEEKDFSQLILEFLQKKLQK